MDLSAYPIVDHHAHPFLRKEVTHSADSYRTWFTESTSPIIHEKHVPNSLFYRTALRWLAELLDCAPSEAAVTEARAAYPEADWTKRLFEDANIDVLLCDYGYGGADAYDHAQMQAILPCRIEPILRLERMAEGLILESNSFSEMVERYVATVEAAQGNGYVALKSIIAYRTGLSIGRVSRFGSADRIRGLSCQKPAVRAVSGWTTRRCATTWYGSRWRLPTNSAFRSSSTPGSAIQTQICAPPIPSSYATPSNAILTCRLSCCMPDGPTTGRRRTSPAIYPNVWADLSLAVPFATVGIPDMMRDMIGMAPLSKLMFATDAFTMPDIYWLAARWGRWGLATRAR